MLTDDEAKHVHISKKNAWLLDYALAPQYFSFHGKNITRSDETHTFLTFPIFEPKMSLNKRAGAVQK